MTIYVHYLQTLGGIEREPVRLFNVEAVVSQGPHCVQVRMQFNDTHPIIERVARVVLEPDTE